LCGLNAKYGLTHFFCMSGWSKGSLKEMRTLVELLIRWAELFSPDSDGIGKNTCFELVEVAPGVPLNPERFGD
jgi:hypothetical protein